VRATLAGFSALSGGLSDTQFNWSPELGRWSIAQNVAHLNAVDGGDLVSLSSSIEDARTRNLVSQGPYRYGLDLRASKQPW
jgi:hypothetical protein